MIKSALCRVIRILGDYYSIRIIDFDPTTFFYDILTLHACTLRHRLWGVRLKFGEPPWPNLSYVSVLGHWTVIVLKDINH